MRKPKKHKAKKTGASIIYEIATDTFQARSAQLAKNITANNVPLKRLVLYSASHPKPKPLTKAQIAKRERDRKLGEEYLAKAHALGVYEERDDDW